MNNVLNLKKELDPAEENIAIQGIKDYILVGGYYHIKNKRRKESARIDGVYKILWKDNIKFLAENEAGVRECFLYQDVFCNEIRMKRQSHLQLVGDR